MGRKKRSLEYVKPFCFYCNKIFGNEIVLHQHQKSVHFNCPVCKKKFPTSSNLCYHYKHEHKIDLKAIPKALPERSSTEPKIFGMSGVPFQMIELHSMTLGAIYWKKRFMEKKEEEQKKNIEKLKIE